MKEIKLIIELLLLYILFFFTLGSSLQGILWWGGGGGDLSRADLATGRFIHLPIRHLQASSNILAKTALASKCKTLNRITKFLDKYDMYESQVHTWLN